MKPETRDRLAGRIAEMTGERVSSKPIQSIGGGCINRAYRLGDWFIKCNRSDRLAMFAAEAAALEEMTDQQAVRVPQPLWHGLIDEQACLVMEYLPLQPLDETAGETLGRQLANLHRQPQPYFGWHRDNTIGSTTQPNSPTTDWVAFWRDQRLGHQLRLAADNGYDGSLQRLGSRLLQVLDALLVDHAPQPALLHGDLWSGNAAMTNDGRPILFDPASYYGDREADIAMTELFGGFGSRFHDAYREGWPLDSGYPLRRALYNLYHILNHLNLFGGGFRSQAQGLMEQLLAECR